MAQKEKQFNGPHPPGLAAWFLLQFLRDDLVEEVLGDLDEKFYQMLKRKPSFKAKLNYWYQVINYLRPFAFRKSRSINSNHYAMFQNYSKIAWRNLFKYKMYSFIKIGGFAIGIAACLLISLYVQHELSYDKHYDNSDRIFRVLNVYNDQGEYERWPAFPAQIAQVLEDNFPEIEKAGRLIPYDWYNAGNNQFRRGDQTQNNYEEGFAYADQELLEILEVPMVYGNQAHALTQPKSIVLSRRMSDKYFPNEDPVGRTVILNEDESDPFVVGGVMENFPSNSHLQVDFFITLKEVEFWPGEQTNWCCYNYDSYVLLRKGTDLDELEKKLLFVRDNYIVRYYREVESQDADDAQENLSLQLQLIGDIRLKSEGVGDIIPHRDIRIVWLFAAIAFFILLLACINFINLSTAKSANRAREVGLRKVVGSFRGNIIQQFLTESIFFSGISVALGTLFAWAFLPYFNILSGKALIFPWAAWYFIPLLALIAVVIGILAGIYPSLYLSAFKPIEVLKGHLSRGSKSSRLRNATVVFQFTASIVLIVGAFIVHRQMQYILNKKLGFDKDQVIMIQGTNTLGEKMEPFKNELLRLADVKNAATSHYLPVSGTKRDQNSFWKDGRSKIDKGIGAQIWRVDQDYINTLGMKLLDGRGFSKDMASDSSSIIINQTMARELGLENPVGQRIMNWRTWTVIGVVEDFHFESLKGDIGSLAFALGDFGSIMTVKVQTENMPDILRSITTVWETFMPNQPIRYTFLDETYAHMYKDVRQTSQIFTGFAILAIIVACLGLFALSAFITEQRHREIGIRKVLGASLGSLFQLLTLNFVKLVLISLIIAIPIAWKIMQKWLEDFVYRTEISWDVFLVAGLMALMIAIFTISYQSIKAALSNPVNSLRSE
ncbi:ABC transporter permease [Fulvivirgaceae bacterium BMA10]|uniref:ABC transporter permease n=1 Tax=Splendidivirga corallicola TaxID=3051826 RepID=A0ABT8KN91_9BACT|nr:ABC transporter permease [Fulvivirgaceae bacterium BMA10]